MFLAAGKMGKYFVYALILFGFILVSQVITKEFQRVASVTYNTYPFIYATIFCSMLTGFLVGLDALLREGKRKGKWKVNAEKLIFMGFPSLYFTFKDFIPLRMFSRVLSPSFLPYINPETITIFAIILGYSCSTSFYKKDMDK